MSASCTHVIQVIETSPSCTSTVQVMEPEASVHTNGAEGGLVNLTNGQTSLSVVFSTVKASADYIFDEFEVENLTDVNPLAIVPLRTARTSTGFTVEFAPIPDTANYKFRWHIRFYQTPVSSTAIGSGGPVGSTILLSQLPAVTTAGLTNNVSFIWVYDPVTDSTSGWIYQTSVAAAGDVTPSGNPAARWRKVIGL